VPDDVPLFLEINGFGGYVPDLRRGRDRGRGGSETEEEPDQTSPTFPASSAATRTTRGERRGDRRPFDDATGSPTANPARRATPVSQEPAPVDLALRLDAAEIAAYWHEGQVVGGTLTVANTSGAALDLELLTATTHFLFAVALDAPPTRLEAGQSVEVPVTVTVQPDAWAGIPVRISLAALVDGRPVSTSADITPTADALPVAPFTAWPLPEGLLGGFDLTSPTHGAVVAGTVDATQEALLHDGVAPIGGGLLAQAPAMPLALTGDLAGDAPAPVAGVTIQPQATDGVPQHQVRRFELLLSTDGVTFTSALTGELTPLAREQAFALDAPVEATHAQLLLLDSYDTVAAQPTALSLGEWTVVAVPGFVPETVAELNVASAALGGHVVRWSPQPPGQDVGVAMLTPDEEGAPIQSLTPIEERSAEWVVAFADDRAALITELRWVDHAESVEENRLSDVEVEVSLDSPSGPWTSLGEWDLDRADDGAVEPLALDEPVWARFVRLSGSLSEDATALEYPAQLSIIEAPTGDVYRSVVGAWGATSPAASYERMNPPTGAVVPDEPDAPDDQADAAPLALGDTVGNYAQIGSDIDWYRVVAGEDDNTLTFTLTGVSTVDVVVRVYSAEGQPVEAAREVQGDASTVTYTAPAEPGAAYDIVVQQPPHSIAFTFDTSVSLANYQPFVQQSLRSFAAGVREGQEFVQLIPFDEDPLLEGWTDDTYLVVSGINGYYDKSLSSSVETGVLDSTTLLAGREGATAVLVITDAETGSYAAGEKMWAALDVTRPRIFSVHIGGSATPVLNEQLLQDLSSAGGYYQYTTSQAEMDRAFDRAATWLRRPTAYGLTVASSFEEATPAPEATPRPPPRRPPSRTQPPRRSRRRRPPPSRLRRRPRSRRPRRRRSSWSPAG
jgi:hypothetical protein